MYYYFNGKENLMKLNSFQDLIAHEIQDLYDAEHKIVKALPKMAEKSNSEELRKAFEDHMRQTQEHIERLKKVAKDHDIDPEGTRCKGMAGLIAEGEEVLTSDGEPDVLDSAMIAAAQRVEHYEMAAYGCLVTYLELEGMDECAELMQKTLDEEGDADKKLTKIAKKENKEAMQA